MSTRGPFKGEYEPSAWSWVAEQVTEYEASGGTRANTLMDTDIPIIVVTTVGRRSGKVRKVPLMRVEHEGSYALIASKGGMDTHPEWYYNLLAEEQVMIQDGPAPAEYTVSQVHGSERELWFERGKDVYPPYGDYAVSAGAAGREIPVFVASPS